MRTIQLVVAYDGTDFHGWQRQPRGRTVQGVLEEVIEKVIGMRVRLRAAGRTDAGVHARGQVASFSAPIGFPGVAVAPALRPHLPKDIQVVRSEEVAPGFDARRSAIARRYAYRLLDHDDVLFDRIAWRPRVALSADGLDRAVSALEGEHDCTSLQGASSTKTRTVCRIRRAGWRRWEGGLMLDIAADHFLYHMVRNVVGTALALMRAPDPADAMRRVLDARQRSTAGATAPPQGLSLEEVFYPVVTR